MLTCLRNVAQMFIICKCKKMDTNFLFLHCVGECSDELTFSIFLICVPCFNSRFSRIALLRNGLQLHSKTGWIMKWLILSILFENSSFCQLYSFWEHNMQQLLHCYVTLTILNLFGVLFDGYFGLFFRCAINFSDIWFRYKYYSALSKQSNFTFHPFASFSLIFLHVVMKKLFVYLWKPALLFSIFLLLTVFWCSFPITAIVSFWMIILDSIFSTAFWRICWFLACVETGLYLKFSRCILVLDLVLKYCSDIKKMWINFSFTSVGWWRQFHHYSDRIFSFVCHVLIWGFLERHFYGNICKFIL